AVRAAQMPSLLARSITITALRRRIAACANAAPDSARAAPSVPVISTPRSASRQEIATRRPVAGSRPRPAPSDVTTPPAPADPRSPATRRYQRDRELPGQPVPQAAERARRVQQGERVAEGRGEVASHLAGPGSESGKRPAGADRQGPDQAEGGRSGQPLRPPPGDPVSYREGDRQHQRELTEQQMRQQRRHGRRRDEITATAGATRDEVAGAPRHALRGANGGGRHNGSR